MRCEWKSVLSGQISPALCSIARRLMSSAESSAEMEFVRGRTPKQNVDAGRVFSGPEAVQVGIDHYRDATRLERTPRHWCHAVASTSRTDVPGRRQPFRSVRHCRRPYRPFRASRGCRRGCTSRFVSDCPRVWAESERLIVHRCARERHAAGPAHRVDLS